MPSEDKQININAIGLKFTIKSMADALSVHPRTLRIWDKEGILTAKRTKKNRRYYEVEDIEDGKVVLFLTQNLFLNIAGVKIILSTLKLDEEFLKDKIKYIAKLAQEAKITEKMQEENKRKNAKRGRKKV